MNDESNWEILIERHLRGELNELEMETLTEILDSDPTKQEYFVQQTQWDTQIAEVIREGEYFNESDLTLNKDTDYLISNQPSTTIIARAFISVAAVLLIAFSVSLISKFSSSQPTALPTDQTESITGKKNRTIAKIEGMSGSLIWTGDRGELVKNLVIGEELSGGTIEGLGPDSWFQLRFHDGSTVTISGNSLLTFADNHQKKLRLREGKLSAQVKPQPAGKPMLIETRSAILKVLGTRFDLKADLTSTNLTVNEGKVNFKRLSDGSEVDVTAQYHVTTDNEEALTPTLQPNSVNAWKSRLDVNRGYGKWQPSSEHRSASLKAIPFTGNSNNTEYKLLLVGLRVDPPDSSPVVLLPGTKFVLRGWLNADAKILFGIRVKYPNGDFAGMFRGDQLKLQPISKVNEKGEFEETYSLENFHIDPSISHLRETIAPNPDGLVLEELWAFTHSHSQSGLELSEVEVIPPSLSNDLQGTEESKTNKGEK